MPEALRSLLGVVFISCIMPVNTFILSDHELCPQTNCSCTGHANNLVRVDCRNLGIVSIQETFQTFHDVNISRLDFSGNLIREVPANAFNNAQTVTELDLSNNPLTSIASQSLLSLDKLESLSVQNTSLTALPTLHRPLLNLEHLSLFRTNLNTIDDSFMKSIGLSLTSLEIGFTYLTAWPGELRHLQFLRLLALTNNHIRDIPDDAFLSFAHSLERLNLSNNSLARIPGNLARLTKLFFLTMDSNNLGNSAFHEGVFRSVGVQPFTLSIRNTSVKRIPIGLKSLTPLTHLDISHNDLAFIREEDVANIPNVATLKLSTCSLTRIPSALHTIQTLEFLNLSDNPITTIEYFDLHDFSALSYMNLSNGRLAYISDTAFDGLDNLRVLFLGRNFLAEIPHALQHATGLQRVDMDTNPVQCSCDMRWIKSAFNDSIPNISGDCENVYLTIGDYIDKILSRC